MAGLGIMKIRADWKRALRVDLMMVVIIIAMFWIWVWGTVSEEWWIG
jgi:hypothetical protein